MRGVRPIALVVFVALLVCLQPVLPLWLTFFSLAGIVWKAWALRTGRSRIPKAILLIMAIFCWALIAVDSPTLWHRNTMIAVSVLATLFNLLPPAHKRQEMRLHAAFFALLIGVLVIPRSPLPIVVYGFLTLLIFASLLLHNLPSRALRTLLPLGKNILKTALPVTIVLMPIYFFFPEIRPSAGQSFSSGLAGDLEPGRIAKLALSDRLAFRVRFLGDEPPPKDLYWRINVLESSEGMVWKKGESSSDEVFHSKGTPGRWTYEIMPDIRLGSVIPMLEHTVTIQEGGDDVLWQRSQDIFRSAKRFLSVSANTSDRFAAPRPSLSDAAEPEAADVKKLVGALKLMPAERQASELLNMFRSFEYTLNPGTLSDDNALSDFLFAKRRGFCEHFAAAFASLLRMAGTPARVVVGFQGGTPLGANGFMQVLDADAHAWTEVWMNGQWVRIDPSAVAIGGQLRQPPKPPLAALFSAWSAYLLEKMTGAIKSWSGESDLLWLTVVVLASGLLVIQVLRILQRRRAIPPWERDMALVLHKLSRRGVERAPGETVRNFLKRAGGDELAQLGELYNAHKFGRAESGAKGKDERAKALESALQISLKNLRRSEKNS